MRGTRFSLLMLGLILLYITFVVGQHRSGDGAVLGLWSIKYALVVAALGAAALGVAALGLWAPLRWFERIRPALAWIQAQPWMLFLLFYLLLESWYLARWLQRRVGIFVTYEYSSLGPLAIEREAGAFLLGVALLLIWLFASLELLGREPESLRSLGANLALGVISLGLSFALFAVGYAGIIRASQYVPAHNFWGELVTLDPDYGFRNRAGIDAKPMFHEGAFSYQVSTDADGFRNTGDISAAPLAAIGDSFVFGVGVESEDLWLNLLAESEGIAVANYGVSGYGMEQYNRLAADYAAPRDHTLVLLGFYANDLPGAPQAEESGSDALFHQWYWQWQNPINYTIHDMLLDSRSPTLDVLEGIRFGVRSGAPAAPDPDTLVPLCDAPGYAALYDPASLPLLLAQLDEAAALADAGDYQAVLLLLPSKLSVYRETMLDACPEAATWLENELSAYAALCSAAEERGIPCYDATEDLRAAAGESEGLLYFPIDTHWNAAGNRAYAGLLADFLHERDLLP